MQIGIRELKAKLSEYVRLAREGEPIEVTDHGQPVARLTPLPSFYPEPGPDSWTTLREPNPTHEVPAREKRNLRNENPASKRKETYANLLKQAKKNCGTQDSRTVITEALEALIHRQRMERVIDAFGTIEWDADYDYKKQRQRP